MKVLALILLSVTLVSCDTPQQAPTTHTSQAVTTAPPATAAQAEPGVAQPQLELPFQHTVSPGVVAAGQPTPAQFGELKAAGYTAVVNLRPAAEAGYYDGKTTATSKMMLYNHIPIAGPDDLTRENVEKLAATMNQPMAKNGKVLVHCGSSNRAGAMLALKAGWIDGASKEDALAVGREAGMTSLEAPVTKLLESDADGAE